MAKHTHSEENKMTFEQWWEGRADKELMDKPTAKIAFEWAWQRAKETYENDKA
jgi:hypothetical protein